MDLQRVIAKVQTRGWRKFPEGRTKPGKGCVQGRKDLIGVKTKQGPGQAVFKQKRGLKRGNGQMRCHDLGSGRAGRGCFNGAECAGSLRPKWDGSGMRSG